MEEPWHWVKIVKSHSNTTEIVVLSNTQNKVSSTDQECYAVTFHSEQLRPVTSFLRKTSVYLSCLYLMLARGWSPRGTLPCKARQKSGFLYVCLCRVFKVYGKRQTAASRNWCSSSQNRNSEGKAPTSVFVLGKGWDLAFLTHHVGIDPLLATFGRKDNAEFRL